MLVNHTKYCYFVTLLMYLCVCPPCVDTIVDDRGTYGRSYTRSSFNYLSCLSSYTSLSQCSVIRKGSSSCFLLESGSTCGYREYGLTCFGKPIQ